jgi:competence protein ComEC
MKSKIVLIALGLVGLVFFGLYQLFVFSDNKLHVVFCDVGQGDAIFIRTPQQVDMLIDGGPNDSVLNCLSHHMPFWDHHIDLVFATHPDADHISGLVDVVNRYDISEFGTSIDGTTSISKELDRVLRNKRLKVQYIHEGDRFRIGSQSENSENSDGAENSDQEVVLETLWPQQEYVRTRPTDDTNSYSLVQKVTYGKNTVLLTGDITFDIFNQLMADAGHINILKAPHHGSYTGINEDTFLYNKPQIVIISDGKNNRYGHPHASVLKVLDEHQIPYLRTDQVGEIEFVSDGKTIWLKK